MAITKKSLIGKSTSAKSSTVKAADSKGRSAASKLDNTKQTASKVVAAMRLQQHDAYEMIESSQVVTRIGSACSALVEGACTS